MKGSGQQGELQNLIALETLKALKSLRKKKESDAEDSEDEVTDKLRTTGFKAISKLHAKVRSQPKRVAREYASYVKEQLGVSSEQQYWQYRD
eukprot:7449496-Karenia_brevis.AAC.1